MKKTTLYVLAAACAVLGLSLFAYKWLALGFPFLPQATAEAWDVEIRVRFQARGEPVRVTLRLPQTGDGFGILDENFVSQGYGLLTRQLGDDRQAVWSMRRATGEQTLYYRALIQRFEERSPPSSPEAPEPSLPTWDESRQAAAQALLDQATALSADLDSLIAQLTSRLAAGEPGPNVALLLGEEADLTDRARAAVRVLALGATAARVIRGLRLGEGETGAALEPWLEVWDGAGWVAFDPSTGERSLPEDFLVLVRGNRALVGLDGGSELDSSLSARPSPQSGMRAAMLRQRESRPLLWELSLFRLPLEIQAVYQVLLLLPIGCFLLVLMRVVVGVRTIGTFMPVLIGLAFRETRLGWGLLLFSVVLAVGLWGRFYLERLKLMLVPRLAAVLFMVVFLMAAMSILANSFGVGRALSVALFPMVILTITIEHMSVVWEERGPRESIAQALGSLATAVLAYLVMFHPWVGHWSFVFPELLLVLLAGVLVLGRYSGYRLTELPRFKVLAEQA